MEHQENKYLVRSFDETLRILQEKGARQINHIISVHYYGKHKGNDVEKFVEYPDRYEIHVLKEENGRFTLTEHSQIADKHAGIAWLKSKKYRSADIVKMDYTEYAYNDGTVGLYMIDDFLRSVILYYPSDQFENVEKELNLQHAEPITVPYNKYLEQLGRLRSIQLP